MSQLEDDCAKYLQMFIKTMKDKTGPGYHAWHDCHMAIFAEHYPEGWYELRFESSDKKRDKYMTENKLPNLIFEDECVKRVQACLEHFPHYLDKIVNK